METKHDNKQYAIFISYRSMHKAWVDLPRAPVPEADMDAGTAGVITAGTGSERVILDCVNTAPVRYGEDKP